MCYVCVIDSGTQYTGSMITPADTAFADQFAVEFRDLARQDLHRWLAERNIGLVVSEEELAAYDQAFLLGAQVCLRLLNHHDLIKMLDER